MRKTLMLLILAAFVFGRGQASAFPTLQLDIENGYYLGGSEQTIVSQGSSFTVYGILTNSSYLYDTFYISAAVAPQFGPNAGNLGSFSINGKTYSVTKDLTYGTPPLNDPSGATYDPGDLSKHGVFQTYFTEVSFKFDPKNRISPYDTALDPGGILAHEGTGAYWYALNVDTSGLDPLYAIHFDLYNESLKWDKHTGLDLDVDKFAPYSHDAQSGSQVAVPSSMLLLASGLLALAWRYGGLKRNPLPKISRGDGGRPFPPPAINQHRPL